MAHTARVTLIDPATASGETQRLFASSTQSRGRVPNSARVWANIPYVAKFHYLSGLALQREGAGGVLTCRIKEMAVLKTSNVNSCAY